MSLIKIADGKFFDFHCIVGLLPVYDNGLDHWSLFIRSGEYITPHKIAEPVAKEIASKIEHYQLREETVRNALQGQRESTLRYCNPVEMGYPFP